MSNLALNSARLDLARKLRGEARDDRDTAKYYREHHRDGPADSLERRATVRVEAAEALEALVRE
jgi:hypothetical protein